MTIASDTFTALV